MVEMNCAVYHTHQISWFHLCCMGIDTHDTDTPISKKYTWNRSIIHLCVQHMQDRTRLSNRCSRAT